MKVHKYKRVAPLCKRCEYVKGAIVWNDENPPEVIGASDFHCTKGLRMPFKSNECNERVPRFKEDDNHETN